MFTFLLLQLINVFSTPLCVCVLAFEASTSVTKKCHQEFERVKANRFLRFSQCFEHVSVAIQEIYKDLCMNDSAQVRLSVTQMHY